MMHLRKFDRHQKTNESLDNFKKDTQETLLSLTDEGFKTEFNVIAQPSGRLNYYVRIYKPVGSEAFSFKSPEFECSTISADFATYLNYMTEELGYEAENIYTLSIDPKTKGFLRTIHSQDEALGGKDFGKINCISVEFKNK